MIWWVGNEKNAVNKKLCCWIESFFRDDRTNFDEIDEITKSFAGIVGEVKVSNL